MKIIKICVFLAILSNFENIFASEKVTVFGAGTATCESFLQGVRGSESESFRLVVNSWAQGYLSGRNRQLSIQKLNPIDLSKAKALDDFLIIACERVVAEGKGRVPVGVVLEKIFDSAFEENQKP